ncbi:hypothetical protein KFL_002740120 [Klebsormidium nitens]|uniref:Aminoacyl-transfer RNA synthetases class-II family profile domain-containing protein n=1 Tax=Klebsormidium nitens TaxID=105231 RepID=A0A1Y1I6M8_KLENI|nr:hypothetical protein KFL_002740120 [Klebsormidium nitens]|eukprot:GAQ86173.1 hypothetical protein KFL_002740120 [Klebsormidium nitens]
MFLWRTMTFQGKSLTVREFLKRSQGVENPGSMASSEPGEPPSELLENLSEHDEAFLDTGSHLSESAEGSQLAASNRGDPLTEVQRNDQLDKGPSIRLNQEVIESRVASGPGPPLPFEKHSVPDCAPEIGVFEQPVLTGGSVSSVKATSQFERQIGREGEGRLSTASLGSLESFGVDSSETQHRYSSASEDLRSPLHEKHNRNLKSGRKFDQPLSGQKTASERRLQEETSTDPEHLRALKFEVDALRQGLRASKEDRRRAEHEKQSMRKELDRVLAAKQEEMDEVIRGVMVEMREGEEEMRRAREMAVAAKSKEMEKALRNLKEKHRKAEDAAEVTKRASQIRIEELEAQLQMVELQLGMEQEERANLSAALERLEGDHDSAKVTLEAAKKEVCAETGGSLEREARDQKERIAELKRMLESAQKLVIERETDLSGIMKQFKKLPAGDNNASPEHGRQEADALHALMEELERWKRTKEAAVEQGSNALAEVNKLENQCSRLESELSRRQAAREAELKQIVELSERLKRQETTNDLVKREKESLVTVVTRLQEDLKAVQIELSHSRRQVEEMKAERDREAAAQKVEVEEMQLKLFEKEGQVDILSEKLQRNESLAAEDWRSGFTQKAATEEKVPVVGEQEQPPDPLKIENLERLVEELRTKASQTDAELTLKDARIEEHQLYEARLRTELQIYETELAGLKDELQKWPTALREKAAEFALQRSILQRDKEELELALEDARLRFQEAEGWHEEEMEQMNSIFREREAHIESELRQLQTILSGGLERQETAGKRPEAMREDPTVDLRRSAGETAGGLNREHSGEGEPAEGNRARQGLEGLVESLRSQMQKVKDELSGRTLDVQAEQKKNAVLLGIVREMKMRWDARERDFARARRDAAKEIKQELSATVRRLEETRAELAKREETIQELSRERLELGRRGEARLNSPQLEPITFRVLNDHPSDQEKGAEADFVTVKAADFFALKKLLEDQEHKMDDINRLAAALEEERSPSFPAGTPAGESYEKPPEPFFNNPPASDDPAPECAVTEREPDQTAVLSSPSAFSDGHPGSPIISLSPLRPSERARPQWQPSEPLGFGSTIDLGDERFNRGLSSAATAGLPHQLGPACLLGDDYDASPTSHFAFPSPDGPTFSDQSGGDSLIECQAALDSALVEIQRRLSQSGAKGAKGVVANRALGRARARLSGAHRGSPSGSAASSPAQGFSIREEAQRRLSGRQLLFGFGRTETRSPSDKGSLHGGGEQQESASLSKLREFAALRSRSLRRFSLVSSANSDGLLRSRSGLRRHFSVLLSRMLACYPALR